VDVILFTHPNAPLGAQAFGDAVRFIDRAPGNSVYAVAAMEDAADLLTMIARSNPEVLEAVLGDYRDLPDPARFPAYRLAAAALSAARNEEEIRKARIAAAAGEQEEAV
jgi:hypothetical protein